MTNRKFIKKMRAEFDKNFLQGRDLKKEADDIFYAYHTELTRPTEKKSKLKKEA